MRVWIVSDKRWGESTQRHYQVEWQTRHPKWEEMTQDERDDFDPANHPWHFKRFPVGPGVSRDEARKQAVEFAKSVVKESFWGCVDVTYQVLELVEGNSFDWEDEGQPETVEDEEYFERSER